MRGAGSRTMFATLAGDGGRQAAGVGPRVRARARSRCAGTTGIAAASSSSSTAPWSSHRPGGASQRTGSCPLRPAYAFSTSAARAEGFLRVLAEGEPRVTAVTSRRRQSRNAREPRPARRCRRRSPMRPPCRSATASSMRSRPSSCSTMSPILRRRLASSSASPLPAANRALGGESRQRPRADRTRAAARRQTEQRAAGLGGMSLPWLWRALRRHGYRIEAAGGSRHLFAMPGLGTRELPGISRLRSARILRA